ncbi:Uncharacterised protein [Klebsiella quasipneumoniae]|nr:Uncharacterised protein [Klebsiella quasipneumoniae]
MRLSRVTSAKFALPVNRLRYAWHGAGSAQGAASRRRPLYPRAPASKIAAARSLRLILQASGRAEAASLQNTALSPHPCGLPRPSGNVSAILRPSAPAVSVAQVGKSGTGRRDPVGRARHSRHPTTSQVSSLISCPAALRLPGVGYMGSGEDPVGRISVAPSGTVTGTVPDGPATLRLPGQGVGFRGAFR